MRIAPMIQVDDVEVSSRWYQDVLGLASAHGGDEYEMLTSDGVLVLQLHRWDAHEHPFLGSRHIAVGNGISLWFETAAFDEAVERATSAGGHVMFGPEYNPNAHHHEIALNDPDGYVVVINSPFQP
jgi:catechol 2,3-dioxygenase-like lactoylglutathione lyase family enzyme